MHEALHKPADSTHATAQAAAELLVEIRIIPFAAGLFTALFSNAPRTCKKSSTAPLFFKEASPYRV